MSEQLLTYHLMGHSPPSSMYIALDIILLFLPMPLFCKSLKLHLCNSLHTCITAFCCSLVDAGVLGLSSLTEAVSSSLLKVV